jgi:hypothetical protein
MSDMPAIPGTIEDHVELYRKYGVLIERIQAYDKILDEFKKMAAEFAFHKQSVSDLSSSMEKENQSIKSSVANVNARLNLSNLEHNNISQDLNDHKKSHQETATRLSDGVNALNSKVESMKSQLQNHVSIQEKAHEFTAAVERMALEIKKMLSGYPENVNTLGRSHGSLSDEFRAFKSLVSNKVEELASSFKNMPKFEEWAARIWTQSHKDRQESQREIYDRIDKKSQQLETKLFTDPYTADSIKKSLQEHMDTLALDGKNAYLKVNNMSQQIQILEKKIENVNLLLKKYELNK